MSKLVALKNFLGELDNLVIALSGGVDSSVLLSIAATIPKLKLIAITCITPYTIQDSVLTAETTAKQLGIEHITLSTTTPMAIKNNPSNRCYLCKHQLFGMIIQEAKKRNFSLVADGTNVDDVQDYRPGIKALEELQISSPLLKFGFTKQDVRYYANELGLSMANKPSDSCLLTRFPMDATIENSNLQKIYAGERILHELGFNLVRLRHHGNLARIEIGRDERAKMIDINLMDKIADKIKALGYKYVSLELTGYVLGSMNVDI